MAGAQWLGFLPPPYQKPGMLEGLTPIVQGFMQGREKNLFAQDLAEMQRRNQSFSAFGGGTFTPPTAQATPQLQAFSNELSRILKNSPEAQRIIKIPPGQRTAQEQSTLLRIFGVKGDFNLPQTDGSVFGGPAEAFIPQSQQMKQMMAQQFMPMTPYQKTMSDAAMMRAQAAGMPTPLSPTQQRAKDQKRLYDLYKLIPPDKRSTEQQAHIDNWEKPSGPAMTTINIGGAQRSTLGAMEREYNQLKQDIMSLDTIRNLYQDKFSTYGFKGRKYISTELEKIGITPGERRGVITASKEEIQNYSKWFGQAETQYLTFRKWATGVAGGPAEMAQIRQAFPDPKDKAPTEFKAMLEQAISYKQVYADRLAQKIAAGEVIDKDVRSRIAMEALSDVLNTSRAPEGDITLETATPEDLEKLTLEQAVELQRTGKLTFPTQEQTAIQPPRIQPTKPEKSTIPTEAEVRKALKDAGYTEDAQKYGISLAKRGLSIEQILQTLKYNRSQRMRGRRSPDRFIEEF